MSKIRAKLLITREEIGETAQSNCRIQTSHSPRIRSIQRQEPIAEEQQGHFSQDMRKLIQSFKAEIGQANMKQLLEVRDKKIEVSIPKLASIQAQGGHQIERWLTKVCSDTFSIAFQQYRTGTMNFNQSKIFCSENIIRNIALISEFNKLKSNSFQLMDRHLKNGILKYMMAKYPLTQSTNISKRLNSAVKEIDHFQRIQYDFFYSSDIVFELRESGNYNDLIMKVINAKLKEIDEVEENNNFIEYGWSNYKKFENYFANLFERVEDEEWMRKKDNEFGMMTFLQANTTAKKIISGETKDLIEGAANFVMYEQEKKKLSKKEKQQLEEKERQKCLAKQKYRQKVKEYTHFLIGRKISENVLTYTQKQIDNLHLTIKNPSILRILTKWCEQLWEKFQNKDYYLNNHEDGLKAQRGGNVNTISLQLKQSLCKLMAQERGKIQLFMSELAKNNYQMQQSLLKKELQNEDSCTFIDPLEKACGVFSIKVVNNLHNYIITYLNRLIHGLLKVAEKWYSLNRSTLKAQIWPSPPNLLTLKIGDLMRCKCQSRQNQIITIYKQIVKLSRQSPEDIKIIRVKNRLKKSTNDVLLNVRLFNKLVCEIQLSVKSNKSQFLEYSNEFGHFLYELKRSAFGPITELCSIWSSLDQRKLIFQQFLNNSYGQNYQGHACEDSGTANFRPFQRPFICSQCKVAYSHNYYITKHVKCENCNYWRCAKCQLQLLSEQQILQEIIEEEQIIKNCKKINKINLFPNNLPEYGFCIFKCSKVPKVQYFNFVSMKNKNYLFGLKNNEVYEVAEVSSIKKFNQFLNNYLIFNLPKEICRKKITIDLQKANHQYLLVKYKNEVFYKQRESICLQQQNLTNESCQIIFSGQAKEKQNIKHLNLQQNKLTNIKFICQQFPNLTVLQLNSNKINNFSGIEQLNQLTQLYIGQFPLKQGKFPQQICQLYKLEVLHMQNVELTEIPNITQNLKNLKKIELGNNKLTELPATIKNFEKLQYLSLYSNQITHITEEIGNLTMLETLILSDNRLETVPDTLSLLLNLVKLDLQSNNLTSLSFGFSHLTKLAELDCSTNHIETISEDVGSLPNLRSLNLSNNQLKKMPETILWKNIAILNLRNNQLQRLNPTLFQCPNIIKMELSNNKLQTIDKQISKLKLLTSLNLTQNKLENCPQDIGNLENLTFLSISDNQITQIFQNIGNLNKLEYFYASTNKIKGIPNSIRMCISLKQLYLDNNLIKVIPDSLSMLKNLQENHLDLSQNPLEKVLCLDFILSKGDYATKHLVMQKLHMVSQNEETNIQYLQRLKEASRKRSLRGRRNEGAQIVGKRSVSDQK